jgi:hypothetical protein
VAAAKSLGLPQTLEMLAPSDGFGYVHDTLR